MKPTGRAEEDVYEYFANRQGEQMNMHLRITYMVSVTWFLYVICSATAAAAVVIKELSLT